MAKIWLPIHEPATGRDMILYIPGASSMDGNQLRDIIQAQTEKTKDELRKKGPKPQSRLSKKEIAGALKEYMADLRERQRDPGYKRVY